MRTRFIKPLSCLALLLSMALVVPAQGVGGVSGPKIRRHTTTTTTTPQKRNESNTQNNAQAKKQQQKTQSHKPQQAQQKPQSQKPQQAQQSVRSSSVQFNSSTNCITYGSHSYKLVYISGGTFTMGATSEQGSDAYNDETPTHSVTLSSYYIGQTEVPQWLWKAVMGSNPSSFKGDNRPVEQVSWNDCKSFISKLNSLTGKSFALPTEAQWEFAARGGNSSRGYKYSGSNDISSVAWYTVNCYDKGSNSPDYGTHNVGTKSANELGLYDMSGNVWEWCSDWYGDYSSSSQTNPTGPSTGSNRVYRGGSWSNIARDCRVSLRYRNSPSNSNSRLGLRLALRP